MSFIFWEIFPFSLRFDLGHCVDDDQITSVNEGSCVFVDRLLFDFPWKQHEGSTLVFTEPQRCFRDSLKRRTHRALCSVLPLKLDTAYLTVASICTYMCPRMWMSTQCHGLLSSCSWADLHGQLMRCCWVMSFLLFYYFFSNTEQNRCYGSQCLSSPLSLILYVMLTPMAYGLASDNSDCW